MDTDTQTCSRSILEAAFYSDIALTLDLACFYLVFEWKVLYFIREWAYYYLLDLYNVH